MFIIDPNNNFKYNINTKEAKNLLKKYINEIYGGADTKGVDIKDSVELPETTRELQKDNSNQICNKCVKISDNDYYCIGCESGATQNHWHDPRPSNIQGEELEHWWMKQAQENTEDALDHLE
jgi:hypothetical protein